MEIYLIRHTTPAVEKGICYGQSDIPLADSFQNEAAKLLEYLPKDFDAIYSSPLSRCHILAASIATNLKTDNRLCELNFGDWEMKKWDAINQAELNHWMQDFVNVKVPNGENLIELNHRVNHFADEMIKTDLSKVGVVTHAGVIRCFVSRILEIPLKNVFKIPVDYSSVTKLHISSDGCNSNIEYLNKR